MPYAVLSDQSTNLLGSCEENVTCACVSDLRCPDYILSIFETSNGNAYQEFVGTRIAFNQISTYVTKSGNVQETPPIEYTNPSTTFCQVPIGYLARSTPGCNFMDDIEPTLEQLKTCMGLPNKCDNIEGNACQQGTLALVTGDPSSVTSDNFQNLQLACVRGEACPCGLIAIYDTNFGNVVCSNLG